MAEYHTLPFRFRVLPDNRELFVNEVGDYRIFQRGTARRVAAHDLDSASPLYHDLLSGFFIFTDATPQVLDILATRYRTRHRHLGEFTGLHIFVLTRSCNNSCIYCQISPMPANIDRYLMRSDVMDRAIDLMLRSPAPVLTMEFQGGEPLLNKDLFYYGVRTASDRAKQSGRDVRFVLCTNGHLFDSAVAGFCREYSVVVSTSLDGPAALHNHNRPSQIPLESHAAAVRAIALCQEVLGPDSVSALLTVTQRSLSEPTAIVDEYIRRGLSSVFVRPLNPFGRAAYDRRRPAYTTDEFLAFYHALLDYILELNLAGVVFAEELASLFLRKLCTPFGSGFVDLQSPSGIGSAVCAYDYDGCVYVSDEGRMLGAEGDPRFLMGTVYDRYSDLFYGRTINNLQDDLNIEGLAGCSECAYQAYCGVDPVKSYSRTGSTHGFRPDSAGCQRNMAILDHLISILDARGPRARVLRSWANRG